jgi:hypothetical protein
MAKRTWEAGPAYLDAVAFLYEKVYPAAMPHGRALRILITSFEPGTGKSTLALNLARVAVAHGATTLLIESGQRSSVLANMIPPEAAPGLIGTTHAPRVGYLLSGESHADLCLVPRAHPGDAELIGALGAQGGGAPMPESTSIVIFDGDTLFDEATADLATTADLILVIAGPSDIGWLSAENPAGQLGVSPQAIAGYVMSPVESPSVRNDSV